MKFGRHSFAVLSLSVAGFVSGVWADTASTTQPTRKLRVAVYQDKGSNDKGWINVSKCMAVTPDGFDAYTIDADGIRAGKLAGADVLVQPGGSGSKQAKTLEDSGRDIIKQFVKSGHGYVGICAGSYLASSDYPWSLDLLNSKVVDKKHWARGTGVVKIHFTEAGKQILGMTEDTSDVEYYQGPIMAPSTQPDLAPYQTLATYDTEIAKNGATPGLMLGATAIAAGTCGDGRVIAIGPHPERSPGLDGVIRHAIQWVAAGNPTTQPAPAH